MKLSQVLKLREDLLAIDVSKLEDLAGKIQINSRTIDFMSYPEQHLVDSINSYTHIIDGTKKEISRLVDLIDKDIVLLDEGYKTECKREEQFHLRASVKDNRELRGYIMHADVRKLVKGRLGHYVSWKHPALEIGPGDGLWTEDLVGFDPLYIVDVHEEFLNATKQRFSPEYQRRIRPYQIAHGDLSALPKEQFGFVFAWNVFNYFSIDTIEMYLANIKPLLKPGGVVMFSYNNCENYKSVEMFENHFMTYVPNKDLMAVIKRQGYKVIAVRDEPTMTSWVEISAPGELTSQRAGQTLGKILNV